MPLIIHNISKTDNESITKYRGAFT